MTKYSDVDIETTSQGRLSVLSQKYSNSAIL